MSMKEEQFYQSVKESFDGFAPEVPPHIYEAVQDTLQKRKALVWFGFSMNTWLSVLAVAGAGALVWSTLIHRDVPKGSMMSTPELSGANAHVLYKAHQSIEMEEAIVTETRNTSAVVAPNSFNRSKTGGKLNESIPAELAVDTSTPTQPDVIQCFTGADMPQPGQNADLTDSNNRVELPSMSETGASPATFTLPIKVKKVVYLEKEEKKD